jgi:hypothetical protein
MNLPEPQTLPYSTLISEIEKGIVKVPSIYMAKFAKQNPGINSTMKTHLIDDLDEFGIWTDDYDKFIDKRALKVSEEIKKRIIAQAVDTLGQEPIFGDEDEVDLQIM